MSEHASVAAPAGRGLTRWLVPAALLLVSLLSIGAVFWGQFVAHPAIRVFEFDAGPVEGLAIGRVRPFPELGLYLAHVGGARRAAGRVVVLALELAIGRMGCAVARWARPVRCTYTA